MRHDQPRFKGLTTAEGIVDTLNNRIINLGAPTLATDAARLQDVLDNQGTFYGNTVKHSDDSVSLSGIKVFTYNVADFYVTQNDPNTDEAIINLRANAGVTDHGALTGLLDDDHTQYILVDGTRAFTGNQSIGGNRLTSLGAPVADDDAARLQDITKFYGNTVKQTDGLASFSGITVFNFGPSFYVTQNDPNTDEATISLRQPASGTSLTKVAVSFVSSVEWELTHNIGNSDLVWSTFDDAKEALLPSRADVSDPNVAFFYWAEAVAGRAVVIG